MTHGGEGQTLVSGVKPAGSGPRLIADNDRDDGGLRKSPTGDGFGRGEALRRAAARAQLMEQTAGARVAGDDRGDRSYGNGGFGATELGRGSGWWLWAHGGMLSTLMCSPASYIVWNDGSDMAMQRRASGTAALVLENMRGDGVRGKTKRGSPHVVWRRQRARGRPDGDVALPAISGAGGSRRR